MDSSSKKRVNILPHQKKVVEYITNPKNKGLLVYHSVGSGKTLTSLFTIKELLKIYPDKRVFVIAPPSLLENYKKEMIKVGLKEDDRIVVKSYIKFIREMKDVKNSASIKKNKFLCKDSILVIDEAHNLSGKKTIPSFIKKCARFSFKVILLSATPVKNNMEELVNLIYMVYPTDLPEKRLTEYFKYVKKYEDYTFLKSILRCKVSSYQANRDLNYYPSYNEKIIQIKMDEEYYNQYFNIQENNREKLPEDFKSLKDIMVFMNGIRRAVNGIEGRSPKIEWIINKILADTSKKSVIYSSLITNSISLLKEILDKNNMTYQEVSGSISKDKQAENVKRFNNRRQGGILIISSSGSEGIDLKGVRQLFILEPYWNFKRIEQVMGRVIRYKSHSHLPLEERNVDIYNLIITKPKKLNTFDAVPLTADEILLAISKEKETDLKNVYKTIEDSSIENNNC